MLNETQSVESRLEPPGAGLPWVELQIARLRFNWTLRRTDRTKAISLFSGERDRILALASGCSLKHGSKRVLIPRLRGIEDSSRFWSVFLTLDHLRIVNLGCAGSIQMLAKGKVPERKADTADVKPSPDAGIQSVEEFKRSCSYFENSAAKVADLRTKARFNHPWFGPLNAEGWHLLGGFHMALHRRQIERILDGLKIEVPSLAK